MPPVASVLVNSSENWTDFSSCFSIDAGILPLFFVYEGGGAVDMKAFEIH